MKKLDSFVVTSVVNSIINMSDDDLRSVATILAQYPNGVKLADLVGFAIFDNDMVTNGVDLYEPAEA
mgnify:CR=1 FL=1